MHVDDETEKEETIDETEDIVLEDRRRRAFLALLDRLDKGGLRICPVVPPAVGKGVAVEKPVVQETGQVG